MSMFDSQYWWVSSRGLLARQEFVMITLYQYHKSQLIDKENSRAALIQPPQDDVSP